MARPKNADAAATRGRILAAARALFAQNGRGGTSTRDIAAAAGVSVATLHHYFGSKDALFEATSASMWSGMGSVHKALLHAIDDDDELPVLVDKCVRVAFAFARDNQDSVRMLTRQLADHGGLVSAGGNEQQQSPTGGNGAFLEGFVRASSTLVAAATGRSERRVRLEMSSVVFLIMRYSLATAEQIAALLDIELGDTNEDAVIDALEDHLVKMCLRVLAIDSRDS